MKNPHPPLPVRIGLCLLNFTLWRDAAKIEQAAVSLEKLGKISDSRNIRVVSDEIWSRILRGDPEDKFIHLPIAPAPRRRMLA